MKMISWEEFDHIELRVGTVLQALDFPEARKPAYRLQVDFGPFGVKWTSAQITARYTTSELPGRQVIGVINLPPKRIAHFTSEFLLTGFADENGAIILAAVEQKVPNGSKLM